MGPIWGREEPGGPHVGPIKFAIWVSQAKIDNLQRNSWKTLTVTYLHNIVLSVPNIR